MAIQSCYHDKTVSAIDIITEILFYGYTICFLGFEG